MKIESQSTTQTFRLGHVLSITTGRLLCEGEDHPIDGVYKILNFLTGDNLYTHQLPSASDQCREHVLQQVPQLRDVDVSHVNGENWQDVMNDLRAKYGDAFSLRPLPKGERRHRLLYDDMPDHMLARTTVVRP